MQTIPARLMRAQTEACTNRPAPTERDRQRRAYILEAGRAIFIAHGRLRVTIKDVAIATGLTQIAIRNQVADLDHLFALTLTRHMDEILTAIAAVPREHPDLFARRRAEYVRATRGICNIPTAEHFLWLRERFTLPEDELEPLELRRRMLAAMLAGQAGEIALRLLDSPHLDTPEIEALPQAHASVAGHQAEQAQPQAPPDPPRPRRATTSPIPTREPPPERPRIAARAIAGPANLPCLTADPSAVPARMASAQANAPP